MSTPNPGELIGRYRALRDKKNALNDAHKASIKPYDEALEIIENTLLAQMIEQGVNSFKAETGTAFQKTVMSVSTADKSALMSFVEENGRFDVKFITEVQIRKPS